MSDLAVSTYTRGTFALYQLSVIGETADALGWTAGCAQVEEAVTDALLLLGVQAFADQPNLRMLRVAGRVAIWRAVVQASAGAVTATLDRQTLNRSDLQQQAQAALDVAEREAALLGINTGGAQTAVLGRMTLDWAEPALPWFN